MHRMHEAVSKTPKPLRRSAEAAFTAAVLGALQARSAAPSRLWSVRWVGPTAPAAPSPSAPRLELRSATAAGRIGQASARGCRDAREVRARTATAFERMRAIGPRARARLRR